MSYEIKGQRTLQRRWTGVGAAGGVAGDTLVLALIAVSDRLLLSGRPSRCLGTVSRCCLSEVMSFWDLESSRKEIQGRQVGAQSFAETFLQDICTPSSGAQGRVPDTPLDVGPGHRMGGWILNGDHVSPGLCRQGSRQGGSRPASPPGHPKFGPLYIPRVWLSKHKEGS